MTNTAILVVVVVIAYPAQAVASLHHGPAEWTAPSLMMFKLINQCLFTFPRNFPVDGEVTL